MVLAQLLPLVHLGGVFGLSINRFNADPQAVSDILDLQPTFVARKGKVSSKSGRPYEANLWRLDVYPERLFGGVEHASGLAAIVELLRGREQKFARLRQEVGPEIVSLYGGIYVRQDEQCGVWLDPEEMRVLALCEVGWGLDVFTAD
jgi:hypothetical protein